MNMSAGLHPQPDPRMQAGLHPKNRTDKRLAVGLDKARSFFDSLPRQEPLWGKDFSANNDSGNTTVRSLLDPWDSFVIIRVTGGLGNPVWMDESFGRWERELQEYLLNLVKSYYGFPITPRRVAMDTQIRKYTATPATWRDRIPLIDYERYGPDPALSCTPDGLVAYIRGVWKRIGVRDTILYANSNFWNEAPYTGKLKQMFPKNHQRIHLMQALYRSMDPIEDARAHYHRYLPDMDWYTRYGGKRNKIVQYGIGKGNKDLNACLVPVDELRMWARSGVQGRARAA